MDLRRLVRLHHLDIHRDGAGSYYTLRNHPLAPSSHPLAPSSHHLAPNSHHLAPTIDFEHLKLRASRAIAGRKSVSRAEMEDLIVELCREHPLSLDDLVQLIDRSKPTLQNNYLRHLIQRGVLHYVQPSSTHPKQRYTVPRDQK